ncbi:hypothetical protein [Microbulbifer sp. TYP-18]|uniref:hypothetical protein n=1 Tax=Microbulbifer sp. TYP-18 TaxID=3230024 RepID=UPI0034C5C286
MSSLFPRVLLVIAFITLLVALGPWVTEIFVSDDVFSTSQERTKNETLTKAKSLALMCLDNPIEKKLIQKIVLVSIKEFDNINSNENSQINTSSYQGSSLTPSNTETSNDNKSNTAEFKVYTVFAIPIAKIQTNSIAGGLPGSCKRL